MNEANYYAVYYEFLSILFMNPQAFDGCMITEEHLGGDIRKIFTCAKDLYKKTGEILITELIQKRGVNADLVFHISDYYVSSSPLRFNRLQQIILDKYKENKIVEYTDALSKGVIDLDSFDYEYKKLMDNQLTESEYLTSDMLVNSCMQSNRYIRFTRFTGLNEKLKLYEGDFMVLAGGTGVGKTALALNLLEDLSIKYECMYFNMEMSVTALHQRLIGLESYVPISNIPGYRTLDNNTVNNINSSINRISQRKISIINGSQSIEQIKNKVAALPHDKHMIIFIDHIGLVKYARAKSAYERATEVAKELRRICLDYNCTIIGLCQLSRIQREDKKPRLSMLRDSGEIEQSARKVMFIWETVTDGISTYEMVIEKNDANTKGIIRVDYNKQTQRIAEYAKNR